MQKFMRFMAISSDKPTKIGKILDIFAQLLDELLLPLIIGIGIIGTAYGIWLGIQYARTEGDARGEAKKRIINFLIGLVSLFVLLLLLRIYTENAESLITWVEESILGDGAGQSSNNSAAAGNAPKAMISWILNR